MDKSTLKPGDMVIMNHRYTVPIQYRGRLWKVISAPYDVCGTLCVKLEGMAGGYAADGLRKVQG